MKRTDIHTILVPGSGAIVIGQAAEFDYSGTQAVKALKAEGYRVVLVNSNPATIMTDPEIADATADEVLALKPDGVFLSNGPGDPAGLSYAVEAVSGLIESGVPIFGICLGHQLIGRALGADTHRLKFGHHGGNHPVQYLPSGEVLITAQNHNYCVTEGDLNKDEVEITYKSLDDDSLEGLRMKNKPVFSVQFHPEAAPGPHDAHDIFGEFIKMMKDKG